MSWHLFSLLQCYVWKETINYNLLMKSHFVLFNRFEVYQVKNYNRAERFKMDLYTSPSGQVMFSQILNGVLKLVMYVHDTAESNQFWQIAWSCLWFLCPLRALRLRYVMHVCFAVRFALSKEIITVNNFAHRDVSSGRHLARRRMTSLQ